MNTSEFMEIRFRIRGIIHHLGMCTDLLYHLRQDLARVLDKENGGACNEYKMVMKILQKAMEHTRDIENLAQDLEKALQDAIDYLEKRNGEKTKLA